jgi:hypothetical protein
MTESPAVAHIDERLLVPLVRKRLNDPSADLRGWSRALLQGGLTQEVGLSSGLYRFTGHAASADRLLPWSLVLKVVPRSQDNDEPSKWDYWKREILAYESGLLEGLADDLRAPRCFGISEFPGEQFGIWLEDVPETGPDAWPLGRFGLAARHLAQFNGAYLTGRPLPTRPWLSHGRIREWLALGDAGIQNLSQLARSRIGSAWLAGRSVERTRRLWRARQPLLDALDGLPRCLCHHDAFRRNLIASHSADGRDQTVAIDWAGIGIGVVGEELATLVSISLQFLNVEASEARSLDANAFEGYLLGLRDVGWSGDERQVRFGFAASASLYVGLGATGGWLAWLLSDERHVAMTERVIGHPLDRILDQWARLQEYGLDLGEEALELLGGLAS